MLDFSWMVYYCARFDHSKEKLDLWKVHNVHGNDVFMVRRNN